MRELANHIPAAPPTGLRAPSGALRCQNPRCQPETLFFLLLPTTGTVCSQMKPSTCPTTETRILCVSTTLPGSPQVAIRRDTEPSWVLEREAHRKLTITLGSEDQWGQVCPAWELEGSVCPTSSLRGSGVPQGSFSGSAEVLKTLGVSGS